MSCIMARDVKEPDFNPNELIIHYDEAYFEGVEDSGLIDPEADPSADDNDAETKRTIAGEGPSSRVSSSASVISRVSSARRRVFSNRPSFERTSPTSPLTNSASVIPGLDNSALFIFGSGGVNEDTKRGDFNDSGCVFHAAAVGDYQKIKFFLSRSRLVLDASDLGYTAVHFAAAYGRAKILETLIKAGADPNALNRKNDVTPLHLASAYGHPQCVRILLGNGADHRLLTTRLISPLEFALERNHPTCVRILTDRGASLTWNCDRILGRAFDCWKFHLILAIINREKNVVDHLLDNKLVDSPNFILLMRPFLPVLREFGFVQDSGQWLKQWIAPLQLAVVQNSKPIVKSLLEHGSDLKSKSAETVRTPLQLAVTRGDNLMVNLLLKYGADPGLKNAQGQTALQLIAGSPPVKKRFMKTMSLLEYGAKPSPKIKVTFKPNLESKVDRQALLTQRLLNVYPTLTEHFKLLARARKFYVAKQRYRSNMVEILKQIDHVLVQRMESVMNKRRNQQNLSSLKHASSTIVQDSSQSSESSSGESEEEDDDETIGNSDLNRISLSANARSVSHNKLTSARDSGEQDRFGFQNAEHAQTKRLSNAKTSQQDPLIEKPRVHNTGIHRLYTTRAFGSSHDYLQWATTEDKQGPASWKLRLLKAIRCNCYRCVAGTLRRHDVDMGSLITEASDSSRQFCGLHLAAKQGNHFIIDLLLKIGVPINAKDSTGNTALHYAVREMQPNAVRTLVRRKADIYARNNELYSPLGMAALLDLVAHVEEANAIQSRRHGMELSKETVVAVLNRKKHATNKPTVTFIANATNMDPRAFFKYVNETFPNLNNPLYHGFTLLHYLVFIIPFRSDFPKKIGILLELGANPNVQDLRGNTPLHYAMERECILVLLHYKANFNIRNQQGKTPMETAAGQINFKVYEDFPITNQLKTLKLELSQIHSKTEDYKREIAAMRIKRRSKSSASPSMMMMSKHQPSNKSIIKHHNKELLNPSGPVIKPAAVKLLLNDPIKLSMETKSKQRSKSLDLLKPSERKTKKNSTDHNNNHKASPIASPGISLTLLKQNFKIPALSSNKVAKPKQEVKKSSEEPPSTAQKRSEEGRAKPILKSSKPSASEPVIVVDSPNNNNKKPKISDTKPTGRKEESVRSKSFDTSTPSRLKSLLERVRPRKSTGSAMFQPIPSITKNTSHDDMKEYGFYESHNNKASYSSSNVVMQPATHSRDLVSSSARSFSDVRSKSQGFNAFSLHDSDSTKSSISENLTSEIREQLLRIAGRRKRNRFASK